eukprot:scaffold122_cov387-Prasinococcus_capsulatus_cf.AAC.4
MARQHRSSFDHKRGGYHWKQGRLVQFLPVLGIAGSVSYSTLRFRIGSSRCDPLSCLALPASALLFYTLTRQDTDSSEAQKAARDARSSNAEANRVRQDLEDQVQAMALQYHEKVDESEAMQVEVARLVAKAGELEDSCRRKKHVLKESYAKEKSELEIRLQQEIQADAWDAQKRMQVDAAREAAELERLQSVAGDLGASTAELAEAEAALELERALWRALQETTPVLAVCGSHD